MERTSTAQESGEIYSTISVCPCWLLSEGAHGAWRWKGRKRAVYFICYMNISKEMEIDLRWPCMYILKLVVALKWSRGTLIPWRGGGVTGLSMSSGIGRIYVCRGVVVVSVHWHVGEAELFGECWHWGGCDLRRRLTSTKAGLCKGCRWSPGEPPWGSLGSGKNGTPVQKRR